MTPRIAMTVAGLLLIGLASPAATAPSARPSTKFAKVRGRLGLRWKMGPLQVEKGIRIWRTYQRR